LVKAGKEALGHAKEQYNIAEHKRHLDQVLKDLEKYLQVHPEEKENVYGAIETLRNALKKMDEENQTKKQGEEAQINHFLVKPRRVSNTNASCYRRFD